MKKMSAYYKMRVSETMEFIKKRYPSINSGGCGIFANDLGVILSNEGYKVEYVFVCRDSVWKEKIDIMIDNKNIDTLMSGSVDWLHILTVVNGYVIDSEGMKTYNQYHRSGIYNTNIRFSKPFGKDILDALNSPTYAHNWNKTFDIDLVKPIQKDLQTNLVLSNV